MATAVIRCLSVSFLMLSMLMVGMNMFCCCGTRCMAAVFVNELAASEALIKRMYASLCAMTVLSTTGGELGQ